jgi:hypothetical protein
MVDLMDTAEGRREFAADRLAEAVVALWRDAARQQTESAAMLNRVVTYDDPRIPNEHEVRAFLQAAVRGALVKTDPPPLTRAQRVWNYLTKWDE